MYIIRISNIKLIFSVLLLIIFICTGMQNVAYSNNVVNTKQSISEAIEIAKKELHNIGDTKFIANINGNILNLKKMKEGYIMETVNTAVKSNIDANGFTCVGILKPIIVALGAAFLATLIEVGIGLTITGFGAVIGAAALTFAMTMIGQGLPVVAEYIAKHACYGDILNPGDMEEK